MNKKQRQQRKVAMFILLGIFLLSIILMNRFVRSSLKQSVKVNAVEPGAEDSGDLPAVKIVGKYSLSEDDPAKYNIKVQGRSDVPLTEQQWEYQMRQGLSSIGQAGDPALVGVEKTPQEIEDQLQEINSQIREYEAITLSNTGDHKSQERLQTLYMLKATLNILKDKVTKRNSRATSNEPIGSPRD